MPETVFRYTNPSDLFFVSKVEYMKYGQWTLLSTPTSALRISLPFYYGWFVISLCFLTTLTSAGVRSSPSVLIHPLEAEFGWSRTLIASAVSMNLLLFGVAAPISGWLIDRLGPRKVMLGSLSLLIVGVSGTMMMTEFWQFFLVWGVIVGLGAGGVGSVLTATVGNRWFVAKRGLALGILGSASSTGQIIFLPLFMAMITYAGWRLGSMALIVVALILLPLIFSFMRDDPSEVGLEPYGAGDPKAMAQGGAASLRGMSSKNATITAQEVITHPTFWLLAGSFFVCGGTANGLIGTHLIPHEIEIGIPQIAAASLLGIMGGLNMVGTIFSGWMIDKVQPQRWLALVYALRGCSLLILPFVTISPAWSFSRLSMVWTGLPRCRHRWRSPPILSAGKTSVKSTAGYLCHTRLARRSWPRPPALSGLGWAITSSLFFQVA